MHKDRYKNAIHTYYTYIAQQYPSGIAKLNQIRQVQGICLAACLGQLRTRPQTGLRVQAPRTRWAPLARSPTVRSLKCMNAMQELRNELNNKYKSRNKLSMQRISQITHENWFCSKRIFLQLNINILLFSHSKKR